MCVTLVNIENNRIDKVRYLKFGCRRTAERTHTNTIQHGTCDMFVGTSRVIAMFDWIIEKKKKNENKFQSFFQ